MRRLTVRISDEEKAALEATAARLGLTVKALVKAATDLLGDLDPKAWGLIEDLSGNLGMSPGRVVSGIMVRRAAERDARRAAGMGSEILVEFASTEDGPLSGEEIYRVIYEQEKGRLQRMEAAQRAPAEGGGEQ